jgi:hypothetical protein
LACMAVPAPLCSAAARSGYHKNGPFALKTS